MNTYNHITLQRTANFLGLNETEISEALQLDIVPICNVSTIEEAENAYQHAPSGCPLEEAALIRWLHLAATTEDIIHVYRRAHRSRGVRLAAIARLIDRCSSGNDITRLRELLEPHDDAWPAFVKSVVAHFHQKTE